MSLRWLYLLALNAAAIRDEPATDTPAAVPAAAGAASVVFEAKDIVVQIPPEVPKVGPLLVVEADSDPLDCAGGPCALKRRIKRGSNAEIDGLVASAGKDEVSLYAFTCARTGECTTAERPLATLDEATFAEATRGAERASTALMRTNGEPVDVVRAADIGQGVRLRAFFSKLIAARRACIAAAIPNAVFRVEDWGEAVPNSLIVTYRQQLSNPDFGHEMRVDVSLLMDYESDAFAKAIAGDNYRVHLESVYASHRVHTPTGAQLRGFSLEASRDFRIFHEQIDTCLSAQ